MQKGECIVAPLGCLAAFAFFCQIPKPIGNPGFAVYLGTHAEVSVHSLKEIYLLGEINAAVVDVVHLQQRSGDIVVLHSSLFLHGLGVDGYKSVAVGGYGVHVVIARA